MSHCCIFNDTVARLSWKRYQKWNDGLHHHDVNLFYYLKPARNSFILSCRIILLFSAYYLIIQVQIPDHDDHFHCPFFSALHYGIITSMILPAMVRTILGLTFTVALAIGCAASVQVRCISSLILPTITGKNGRSYLWALLIAALLAGKCVLASFATIGFDRKIETPSDCLTVASHLLIQCHILYTSKL